MKVVNNPWSEGLISWGGGHWGGTLPFLGRWSREKPSHGCFSFVCVFFLVWLTGSSLQNFPSCLLKSYLKERREGTTEKGGNTSRSLEKVGSLLFSSLLFSFFYQRFLLDSICFWGDERIYDYIIRGCISGFEKHDHAKKINRDQTNRRKWWWVEQGTWSVPPTWIIPVSK